MTNDKLTNKRSTGNYGEKLAVEFLASIGYKIVDKNFHFGHGEIDIIAKEKDILVFVEVKYRKNLEYGLPEYAITKGKQNQIKKVAEAYLAGHEIRGHDCRIDVVAILHLAGEKPRINHYRNAF